MSDINDLLESINPFGKDGLLKEIKPFGIFDTTEEEDDDLLDLLLMSSLTDDLFE